MKADCKGDVPGQLPFAGEREQVINQELSSLPLAHAHRAGLLQSANHWPSLLLDGRLGANTRQQTGVSLGAPLAWWGLTLCAQCII